MSSKDREHVKSEVDCLGICNHMNIIKLKETCVEGNHLVLIAEHADGSDLNRELTARKSKRINFSSEEVAMVWVQVCLAIEYSHTQGILHRDIKPGNIFFTKAGLIKLGDFGLSKHYDETLSNPVGATVCGTPYYISPEMWLGERYNKQSDMWALGIVLYELMMNQRPFVGVSMKEVSDKVLKGEIPPIVGPYPPEMVQVCYAVLCRDRTQRPTIAEVLQVPIFQTALERLLQTVTHPAYASDRATALAIQIKSHIAKVNQQ
jgi:serine/threonine protein kinase